MCSVDSRNTSHLSCVSEVVASKQAALSPTETLVAQRLVAGETRGAIARALRISPKTVDTHRSNLLEKLGLENTIELVWWSLDAGWHSDWRRA